MVSQRQGGIPKAEPNEVVPMKSGGGKKRPAPQTARSPGKPTGKPQDKGKRAKSTGSA